MALAGGQTNQVKQIAASITEFGFTQPILVDGKNRVIAGHGRLLAAKSLGMAEVPVIELAGLSAAQRHRRRKPHRVKRWQQFTGETATLETDGRTFAEIAAARHQEAA
jgi:hypothetical protein